MAEFDIDEVMWSLLSIRVHDPTDHALIDALVKEFADAIDSELSVEVNYKVKGQ